VSERLRMKRRGLADRCGGLGTWARRDGRSWMLIAAFVLGGRLFGAPDVMAQTCEDDNPWQAAALIDQIRTSCERDKMPWRRHLRVGIRGGKGGDTGVAKACGMAD
jgi:hypothetical protein